MNATNTTPSPKVGCNAGTQRPPRGWLKVRWSLGWDKWVIIQRFVESKKQNQGNKFPAQESWVVKSETLWMQLVQSPNKTDGDNIVTVVGGHRFQHLEWHILRLRWMLVHSLCAASRMWVTHWSLVIWGGLECWWDSRKRLCFIHVTVTVKIVSDLPYKNINETWNTHASSSSQEALLC